MYSPSLFVLIRLRNVDKYKSMSLKHITRKIIIYFLFYYGQKIAKCNTNSIDFNKLVVLTLNNDNSKSENDTSKYTLEKKGILKNELEYKFKEDSKCVELKYENVTLWTHDNKKYKDKYPTKLSANPNVLTMWLSFDESNFHTFQFKQGGWECPSGLSFGTCSLDGYEPPKDEHIEPEPTPVTLPIEEKPVSTPEPQHTEEKKVQVMEIKLEDFNNVENKLNNQLKEYENKLNEIKKQKEEIIKKLEDLKKQEEELKNQKQELTDEIDKLKIEISSVPDVITEEFKKEEERNSEKIIQDPSLYLDSEDLSESDLKILTLNDDGTTTVNDKDKYEEKKFFCSKGPEFTKFKFVPNSKCIEVRYKENTLWKYDYNQHGDQFPDKIILNNQFQTLEITKFDVWYDIYKFDTSKNKFEIQLSTRLLDPSKHPNELKLVTMYYSDPFDLYISDFTKFKANVENGFFVYRFNRQYMCVEVAYDHNTVWKYDPLQNKFHFPNQIYYDSKNKLIEVTKFNVWYNLYKCDKAENKFKIQSFGKLLSPSEHPSYLKIITQDQRDKMINKENCFHDFVPFDENGIYIYTFKDYAKCVEVKYDTQTVWNYDFTKYGDKYPDRVYYNPLNKGIKVVHHNDWVFDCTYDDIRHKYQCVSG